MDLLMSFLIVALNPVIVMKTLTKLMEDLMKVKTGN